MLHRSYQARTRRHAWLWTLLPLLLAAGLTVTALGRSVFNTDEAVTMISAGARHIGPYTVAEAAAVFVSRCRITPGARCWFIRCGGVSQVGANWRFASALAHRVAHPCLGLSFRSRPVHSAHRPVGHAAVGDIRPLSDLYARGKILRGRDALRGDCHLGLLARGPAPTPARTWFPGRPRAGRDRAVVLHYFGALLLPALALFHLFFVRKERRWWQPVALLGLAALLALPQVPDLLSGVAHNQEKDLLHAEALRYPEVITASLLYLSNGLLEIRRPFSTLFVLALPLPLLYFGSAQSAQSPATRSSLVPFAHRHPAVLLLLAGRH